MLRAPGSVTREARIRAAVEPEPSSSTPPSTATAASKSGFRCLVPSAELKVSWPSTAAITRIAVTPPGRSQAAWVASSWATSQPSPNAAMAEAARTGTPGPNHSRVSLSISTRIVTSSPGAYRTRTG
jgi:hypothetical protein